MTTSNTSIAIATITAALAISPDAAHKAIAEMASEGGDDAVYAIIKTLPFEDVAKLKDESDFTLPTHLQLGVSATQMVHLYNQMGLNWVFETHSGIHQEVGDVHGFVLAYLCPDYVQERTEKVRELVGIDGGNLIAVALWADKDVRGLGSKLVESEPWKHLCATMAQMGVWTKISRAAKVMTEGRVRLLLTSQAERVRELAPALTGVEIDQSLFEDLP